MMQEMILADKERGRRAALERLLPFQQADFEGIFEAMAGLPVTIRLLDPPLHEFLPLEEQATDERMRARIRSLHELNPMLGMRGCRLGLVYPEIYEMQIRAIARAALAVEARLGEAPLRRDHAPARRLRRGAAPAARAHRARSGRRRRPGCAHTRRDDDRAAARLHPRRGDRRARPSSSPSARTTSPRRRSASRATTPTARSSPATSRIACSSATRSRCSTSEGVGGLMRIAVERRPRGQPGAQARHLRRARRRAALDRLLPRARPRLRLLLALPRPDRPARRRAGRARPGGRLAVRRRRRLSAGRARLR